jgi:flagellar motor switch protein FliN/FliY
MTDDANLPPRPELAEHAQAWVASLAQVLGQITASAQICALLEQAPPELRAAAEDDLWVSGVFSGGLRGEMSLRLAPASALRLAQILMSEPPTPEVTLTPDHREAAIELMRQVAGLVVLAIKPRWGEVQLRLDMATAAPSWAPYATLWLRGGEDPAAVPLIELQVSAALAAALRVEAAEPARAPEAAAPAPLPLPSPQESKVNLDRLLEVELAVTLRFGSRRLLLRQVLDLNPGVVVDLDRQVKDPVDMLLDGRLVARGEVVVMDGNYGLRITEVAPPVCS